jgi:hypothetical protein
MSQWSLPQLLAGLHDDIERRLEIARKTFGHPGTKGNASENVWLQLFQTYLPERYQAANAHVVDSLGAFSQQIDVVLFDRQYSPFIFRHEGQIIVPAESVYAAFEAKQTVDAGEIKYAQEKVDERQEVAPYKPADSACRRHLSAEAPVFDYRRPAHVSKHLESASWSAVDRRVGGRRSRRTARYRLRCSAWNVRLRREGLLQHRASWQAGDGVSFRTDCPPAGQRHGSYDRHPRLCELADKMKHRTDLVYPRFFSRASHMASRSAGAIYDRANASSGPMS